MNKLIAIVGMCGSGKSIATEYFESNGYKKVYFGGLTLEKLKEEGLEINPKNERMMQNKLREEHGMGVYAILAIPKIEELLKDNDVIIDGLYSWEELIILKEKFENIKVIAILLDKIIRYNRLASRKVRPYNNEDAKKRDINEIENLDKGGPIAYADYFILNNGTEKEFNERLNEVNKILKKEV